MKKQLSSFDRLYFDADLKKYGVTEDGEDYIGDCYYVGLEDKYGNRWRHSYAHDGVIVVSDEDGIGFCDNRERARDDCRRFIDKIQCAGEVDLQYWIEDRPVYGSLAYEQYGQDDDIAWERERENDY